MCVGKDLNKDQSYFLWAVPKEQIEKTIFPIGDLEKNKVRKLATKFKLFTSEKKDSQGLCFLGKVDIGEFLSHYIPNITGNILNENGEIIGEHKGAHLYTIGERHGFLVTEKTTEDLPYYVVSKDIYKNIITVSNKNFDKDTKTNTKKVLLKDTNWIIEPSVEKKYMCRFRYRQPLISCKIYKEKNNWLAEFVEPQSFVPVGQSLVVYGGDICLGGGIIESLI